MDSSVKAQKVRPAVAPPVAPDGGYSWFIVLSCFLVFGLTFGVIKAFGVFYVEIHKYFGTTATETSWITSIAVATIHVVGFGYALTWTPTVTMLGLYFEKRRPVANALASAGECILTFVLTPLFQLLIDSYSWRGALLILGALQLNLCVCGMLLRPLKSTKDVTPEVKAEEEGLSLELLPKGDSEQSKTNCQETEELTISDKSDQGTIQACLQDPEDIPNLTMEVQDLNNTTKRPELRTKILRYVDYTLITDAHFMVYTTFGVFAALGFFAPALFLVPYARSKGIEEYQAAALMSISAVLDLFGRVFFGWVQQLAAAVILLGTVLLLCPLASSFSELATFSAAYGLVFGAAVSIHITVLAEVVGVHRLGSALGFFMLIRSTGGLFGPPIAGFFIDQMSDYGAGFLMAGVALIMSAMFLLLLHQMNPRAGGQLPKYAKWCKASELKPKT
ncbi:Monocarboxylate transporter 7 [Nibea albiflora]|uniref:Monocarboxylate transporter 7 n=1 Tax=Nibea albiflora TaxID=240163 RepID=A0ACB7FE49_NIBAL|nr:Monocarboxylate transporter 7 [Nibea albiflora]